MRLGLAAVLLCCTAATAGAQTYPTKPVRLIVAYAAGGGTDTVARVIAQKLSEALGRQVIVDNRPAGSGNLATELAGRAAPDGYTVLVGNVGPMTVNPHLFSLVVDPLRELMPVTQIAAAPLLVVVHPSLPARTLKDLVALAKRAPGQLNYASAGVGSSNHLAGALFAIETGADIRHVPYRGASPAVTDLIGGQVPLSFQTLPSVLGSLRAGRLRAIALTSARRSALVPEVPTAAEAGFQGIEVSAWYGLLVPLATPRAIVDRLQGETARAVKLKEVADRLALEGAEPVGSTPEAFAEFMRRETEKWGRVVKLSGMKPE